MVKVWLPAEAIAKLQAYDGTNWQNLLVQSSNYKNLRVSIYDSNAKLGLVGAASDGVSAPTLNVPTKNVPFVFNGSTWDRLRVHYNSGDITVTGTGATSSIDLVTGLTNHTWTQTNNASSTAPDIRLQGSIDGSNWFDLDTSTAIGSEMRHVALKPVRYIRFNVVSMGDASSITLRYFGRF